VDIVAAVIAIVTVVVALPDTILPHP